jgi:hypothetical protein
VTASATPSPTHPPRRGFYFLCVFFLLIIFLSYYDVHNTIASHPRRGGFAFSFFITCFIIFD